jgi:hypothetical protein
MVLAVALAPFAYLDIAKEMTASAAEDERRFRTTYITPAGHRDVKLEN